MRWNFPNILIIFRFILAIFVIFLLLLSTFLSFGDYPNLYVSYANINVSILNYVALFFFILAAISDWLDGYWARKFNQVTTFGKIFDPLADKILVNSVLIIFTAINRIPIFFAIIFIVRDLLVDGLRIFLANKNIVLSAQKSGKLKTMFQFIGLSVLFIIYVPSDISNSFNYLSWNVFSTLPLLIAMFFSVYSLVEYFSKNWKYVKE